MILGTCNWENKYNNTFVSKEDAFKLLEYFESNGGEIIDTASNYKSESIIAEYVRAHGSKLKIITKIWKQEDLFKSLDELKTDKIHCVLARENSDNLRNFLIKKQEEELIEKWGLSIYLPEELNKSYCNVLQIPLDPIWLNKIQIISLYSKVYFRSFYNLYLKYYDNLENAKNMIATFRQNNNIDFVVGVDNIQQLQENLELFK